MPAEPELKKGKPYLLCYLGVMGPQDGVDYALRSLAKLRDEAGRADWHAVFMGGGDTFDIPWTSAEQRAFAPTGAFTPSRKASRDKGKQYHDYQVANLVRFINWLRTYEGPIGRVETHAATVPAR